MDSTIYTPQGLALDFPLEGIKLRPLILSKTGELNMLGRLKVDGSDPEESDRSEDSVPVKRRSRSASFKFPKPPSQPRKANRQRMVSVTSPALLGSQGWSPDSSPSTSPREPQSLFKGHTDSYQEPQSDTDGEFDADAAKLARLCLLLDQGTELQLSTSVGEKMAYLCGLGYRYRKPSSRSMPYLTSGDEEYSGKEAEMGSSWSASGSDEIKVDPTFSPEEGMQEDDDFPILSGGMARSPNEIDVDSLCSAPLELDLPTTSPSLLQEFSYLVTELESPFSPPLDSCELDGMATPEPMQAFPSPSPEGCQPIIKEDKVSFTMVPSVLHRPHPTRSVSSSTFFASNWEPLREITKPIKTGKYNRQQREVQVPQRKSSLISQDDRKVAMAIATQRAADAAKKRRHKMIPSANMNRLPPSTSRSLRSL